MLAASLLVLQPGEGDRGTTVGVAGDSLVHHAEFGVDGGPGDPGRLSGALAAAGYRPSVTSRVGAGTADLAPDTSFPDNGAELLVVALGTNDMYRDVPIETAIANIEAFVAAIGPRCTVVVTIVDEPSWGLDELGPLYNAALADLAASRSDVVVADWATIVEAHPEYLRWDGVHHTGEGQAAYRELLVGGVAACDELTS